MRDTFYLVLWLTFFILSLSQHLGVRRYRKLLLATLLIVTAFFVGFRDNIGQDWSNYVEFYNTGVAPDKVSGYYEPIFMLIRWLVYSMGFRYEVFFFILSLFSLYLIKESATRLGIKNVYIVFFVYISMFFCFHQLNLVRSGIMATCLWMSIVEKKDENNWKSLLWCLIAAGFHAVALLFIPIIWFINRQYSVRMVIGLLAVGYIVMTLRLGDILLSYFPVLGAIDRVSGYLDPSNARNNGFTIGAAFNLIFLVYLFFSRKKYYQHDSNFRLILNVLIWGLFITSFFNSVGMIATRAGQVLNMSLIFVWPYFISTIINKSISLGIFAIMTVYLLMFYNKAFVPDEILGYSSFTPYHFNYEGLFR